MCHFTAREESNKSSGRELARSSPWVPIYCHFYGPVFYPSYSREDGEISGNDRHEIKKCGLHPRRSSTRPVFSSIFSFVARRHRPTKKTIMTNYFDIGVVLAKAEAILLLHQSDFWRRNTAIFGTSKFLVRQKMGKRICRVGGRQKRSHMSAAGHFFKLSLIKLRVHSREKNVENLSEKSRFLSPVEAILCRPK